MKRPKLKKASKRLSCGKRYKIQKKVREHNRKLRKEAKKKGVTKRVKKDPGVPNVAPFKEEVLREAEQRKLMLEELKAKKKLEKQKERAEKRKKEAASPEDDPKPKKVKKETAKNPEKTSMDKFSRKFLCSELNKVIDASDVIIEVLDARDPLGCRCPQLEEAVLRYEGKKKLLLVLNKIDLVPKKNAEQWLQFLQQEIPTVAVKASTLLQDKTVQDKKNRRWSGAVDQTRGVVCYGGSCLLQLLGDFAAVHQGPLKVGIVGFPNVGKSSLINSLKGVRTCNAGVLRGMTRCKQDIHISKNVKVIDSPGILASPSNPAVTLALRDLPSTEKRENVLDAVRVLLKHCNSQQVMLQYNVPDFKNHQEFLTLFAKKRGFLQKGGIPNSEQAAEVFLCDWTGAKLSYHSKPPENHVLPPYLSDTLVAEMQNGWASDKLQQGNMETIKSVRCPNPASSIAFISSGPTCGLLNIDDVCEVKGTESETVEEEEEEEEEKVLETQPRLDLKEDKMRKSQAKGEKVKKAAAQVTFQSLPVSIDLTSAQKDGDAYDFNVDFK
ncbi:guanine nucleotide-binding protein-like 3 [Paramormyrops kingsleyae]|uniref:Guanine nucleotide-binding protein-like 3 n=1 Tax=Paramormyrops kingsleyae TaxID=1676925 RepID=A0A3B3QSB9_9TELE|nr:guanine nucleotide-binding protein-like 3 [Paramormyrops kingsleyae]